MKPWKKTRRPSPELFAAHASGELDGDAALAPYKDEVEDWLAEHPDDQPSTSDIPLLQDLWNETKPSEPAAAAYAAILEQLQALPATPIAEGPIAEGQPFWARATTWLGLTAAAVWIAFSFWPESVLEPAVKDVADNKPLVATAASMAFSVATSGEIEILSVEGADTASLVIGQPVHGPIELLVPGEVTLTSVQPAAHDNMLPRIHQVHETPMIWARVESEP